MEGVFLVLVGGALFSQAWYILGMYSEGRTMGIFAGGLGLLALGTVVFAFDPVLLTGLKGGQAVSTGSEVIAQATVMKAVVVVWALYAIGVAAAALWDFDERPIGFYSGFVGVATLVAFLYFAAELERPYSDGTWLSLSGATLLLTLVATIMFFYQAFQFNVLRPLSGWTLLIGGSAVGLIGLGIVGTTIS
jgi:hypothetical protein